ncbi:MAG TPA: hypothetical protein VF976_12310 [Gemmatimonadales bacterium]
MSDPVRHPLDEKSDEEVLDLLGPAWSAMTPRQRAAYGPRLDDPYFTALAAFASGTDLRREIVRETYTEFDRIEAKVSALEAKYVTSPTARYRAALARVAGENVSRG